eukprot:UN32254
MSCRSFKRGCGCKSVICCCCGKCKIPCTKSRLSKRQQSVELILKNKHKQSCNWMSEYSDIPLGELKIPGSHNTMTYGIIGCCDRYTICQNSTVLQQLDLGIRYLDIRAGLYDGELRFGHGCQKAFCSVENTLIKIKSWLNKHSSEIIILKIDEEHEHDLTPALVQELELLIDRHLGTTIFSPTQTKTELVANLTVSDIKSKNKSIILFTGYR